MLRCVHPELRDRAIAFQRSDDEEEAENVGEVPNEEEDEGEEEVESEKEVEVERVMRQTRRSHVVAPPIAPAREENRVLLRPLGDSKYIFDLFSLFDSIHDAHFFYLLSFSSWLDTCFDERGHKRQVNAVLGNLLRLHYLGLVMIGAGHSAPVTCWRDYARAPDTRYENAQEAVRNAFWVSLYIFITSVTSCNI
jgi:hypothetical protein